MGNALIGSETIYFYNAEFDVNAIITNIVNLEDNFYKQPIVSELIVTLLESKCVLNEATSNTKEAVRNTAKQKKKNDNDQTDMLTESGMISYSLNDMITFWKVDVGEVG